MTAVSWLQKAFPCIVLYGTIGYHSLVPRPFLCGRGEREKGRKGLVNNSTLTRIHGCIPAVSVDEGKRECQVGVSRE